MCMRFNTKFCGDNVVLALDGKDLYPHQFRAWTCNGVVISSCCWRYLLWTLIWLNKNLLKSGYGISALDKIDVHPGHCWFARKTWLWFQPRSQGPLSTSRKYFLEVERGSWERGWLWFQHSGEHRAGQAVIVSSIAVIGVISGLTYKRDERVNSALYWPFRLVCIPFKTKEYLTAGSTPITAISLFYQF